ncbi:MAG: hypothetical protein R3A52_29765, partial [Polyangiales bacterium]
VGPGVTVQDLGRPGWMHHAVPAGGAWCPPLHRRALASLGAPDDAATVEIPLHGARFTALRDLTVSVDGEVIALRAGEPLVIAPSPFALRYLALPGGVDARVDLGARSTLALAGLGGLDGGPLRRGDVLHARSDEVTPRAVDPLDLDLDAPLGVVLGPDDFAPEAVDRFLSERFTLTPRVDRVGVRVEGPAIASPPSVTAPMVRGAVEVTPDGALVVLGPDHPTTGGYPVIAALTERAQWALALRRPGATLRFTDAETAAPRAG